MELTLEMIMCLRHRFYSNTCKTCSFNDNCFSKNIVQKTSNWLDAQMKTLGE